MAGEDAHEKEVSRNISFFDGEGGDVNTEKKQMHILQARISQLEVKKPAAIDVTRHARQDYEVIANRMEENRDGGSRLAMPSLDTPRHTKEVPYLLLNRDDRAEEEWGASLAGKSGRLRALLGHSMVEASQQKAENLSPLLAPRKGNSAARWDVLFLINEEGAASAANNQGVAFGGVLCPLGGRGPTTAHGGGGFGGGGGAGIPTRATNGYLPNRMLEPRAMFEYPKIHPPDYCDPRDKADPSIWLREMERYEERWARRAMLARGGILSMRHFTRVCCFGSFHSRL